MSTQTEVWTKSKRTPIRLAATVESSRARKVAAEFNARGFKVQLVAVQVAA